MLGWKGQLSELELHTIRARLTAGLLNQAQRGAWALNLPIGFVRDEHEKVHKDPNLEVQQRVDLIFKTFRPLKSANRVLRFFNDRHLLLPRRDRFGDGVWKEPTVAALLSTLKNPAYAGAFVYGRSRSLRKEAARRPAQKRLPMDQWKIRVPDKYPAPPVQLENYVLTRAFGWYDKMIWISGE